MSALVIIARFLAMLFWEFLQNVPPLLGLAAAVLLFATHRGRALAVMVAGGVLGSLAIEITEPLIHDQPPSFEPGTSFWVNGIVFSVLGVLGVLYLSRPQERWQVDAGVGCGLAFLMTLSQALFDGSSPLAFVAHLLAMSLVFGLILRSLRWTLAGRRWRIAIPRTLLLNILGSAIIVAFDYTHLLV